MGSDVSLLDLLLVVVYVMGFAGLLALMLVLPRLRPWRLRRRPGSASRLAMVL
ncbi:MAG: hypothetical protein LRS43_00935 [Desulfurococcales archaeon]|nr:hypothetical protein [Desulfurococcales archaeon]